MDSFSSHKWRAHHDLSTHRPAGAVRRFSAQKVWTHLRRVGNAAFYTGLSLFILVMGVGTWWLHSALSGLDKDLAALTAYQPGEATLLYASDGSLLARIAKENRIQVPLSRIPKALQDATVATEDRRFRDHSGVDFRGVARAIWRDLSAGRAAEGGSTLTMQLVRNIQLSPEKTLRRKVREAVLAYRMERLYGKPRLLEMYLNEVYYGGGAYGVGAAARTWFGLPVERLSQAQCALLATLPRRPTEYNPISDPDGALQRRNRLLKEMAAQGYLSPLALSRALAEAPRVRSRVNASRKAPYFVDAVVDRLTALYGAKAVYEGGLRVQTTLNPALQREAEAALISRVKALRGANVTQGALVSLDPYSGEVKAMVGGVNYNSSAFNRATRARRQPGSAFKPFVYATAMDAGYSPADRITDAPIHLAGWNPKNHYRGWKGQTSLANALAQSMNIPAVKLALAVGLDRVVTTAQSCGIQSPLRAMPSLSLGASEVTLLELTSAYGVFPTMGLHSEPQLLRRVQSRDGRVDDRFIPIPQSAMDSLTARKVDFMLRGVVEAGTGTAVRDIPHARGKTGTTQSDKDAWFVGYTPELVTGVWLGNDRPSRMRSVYGGNGCAPIWRRYMRSALKVVPARPDLPAYQPTPPKTPAPSPMLTASSELKDAPEWRATPTRDAEVTPIAWNASSPRPRWGGADASEPFAISDGHDGKQRQAFHSSRREIEEQAWTDAGEGVGAG